MNVAIIINQLKFRWDLNKITIHALRSIPTEFKGLIEVLICSFVRWNPASIFD